MKAQYSLILFTLSQRLGLGTYLVSIVVIIWLDINLPMTLISAFALLLFIIGLGISMLHLGKLERLLNSYANFQSPLTHEAILSPFVGALLALNIFMIEANHTTTNAAYVIMLLSIVTICFLLYSTASIYRIRTIPAWNTWLVIMIFFSSTALLGSLGVYILAVILNNNIMQKLLILSIFLLFSNSILQVLYLTYINKLDEEVFSQLKPILYSKNLYLWVTFQIAVPIILMLFIVFISHSLIKAIILLLSILIGLAVWQAILFHIAIPLPLFPPLSDTHYLDS